MARNRLTRVQQAKAQPSKIEQRQRTSNYQPVVLTVSLSVLFTLAVSLLLQNWKAGSRSSSSAVLTFGPPNDFYINRSAVPLWQWQPNLPFARKLAGVAHPVVLRHAVPDQWQARQLWKPKYLALHISKLSGVYENDNRWFGPYFDSRKPLASVAKRVNPYRTDLTLSGASLIERITQNSSKTAQFIYYSGAVDDLGQWAIEDIQPLDELLSLNPSVSSVNMWLGPPNVIAHCHYDGYHNFYVQLFGRKRFWLAPPSAWPWLQPAPFLHPAHAQCQVNLSEDSSGHAKHHEKVQLMEVDLEPGDLLYIPPLWFHHVQSLDVSISVNVWTDSSQSAVVTDMFGLRLPGSNWLQAESLQQRAVAAVLIVWKMLAAVCSHINCSGQTRYNGDSSQSKHVAWQFLHSLYAARFEPLLKSSGLPLIEWPDMPSVICQAAVSSLWTHSTDGHDLSVKFQQVKHQLIGLETFADELQVYSHAVQLLATKLPWQTRALWLGNLVEYILAEHVGASLVTRLLLECVHCLLDN